MSTINENRPGYKKTKVGWIPEDWELTKLGETVKFLDHKRKPIKSADRAKMQGAYPYYGASGIIDYVNDYIFDEELILLGEDGANILMRSTPLAFRVSGKIWVNNHAHVLRPNSDMDMGFLTDYLESLNYEKYNTGSAQPKLNKEACKIIDTIKPPLPEQKKIAAILSTWDAAIRKLDRLIERKQTLKKGLMQQLLTGRRRFPEFVPPGGTRYQETKLGLVPEDWEVVRIKDVGFIKCPQISPKEEVHYWYYSIPAFENGKPDYVDGETIKSNKLIVQSGDILFGKLNPRVWKVWTVDFTKNKAKCIASTEFLPVRCKSNFDRSFIFQALHARSVRNQVESLVAGSTGSHQRINPKDFYRVKLLVPSKAEQARISQALRNRDLEINYLQTKKERLIIQKKGLMQQLLTGAVRVRP